jgi:hypothetical protein
MITLALWRALHREYLSHPIYRRLHPFGGIRGRPVRRRLSDWGFFGGLVFLFACSNVWLIVLLAPFVMILTGSAVGVMLATRTARKISLESEKGRFELLQATPPGAGGILWIMCNLVYRNSVEIHRLRRGVQTIYLMFGGLLALMAVFTLALGVGTTDAVASAELLAVTGDLLAVVIWIGLLYCDLIQSVVSGTIAGMLAATLSQDRLSSGGFAVLLYLALQMMFYAAAVVIVAVNMPGVWEPSNAALIFIMVVSLRELLQWGLWSILAKRLHLSYGEWNRVPEALS